MRWSFITLVCNIYTLLSITFWPNNEGYPQGVLLIFDIMIELWLLLDIVCRIALRLLSKKMYQKLRLLHSSKTESWPRLVVILIGSFPHLILLMNLFPDHDGYNEI